jgi:hypothetical protein
VGRRASDKLRPAKLPQSFVTARIAAYILGSALIVWGVAPAIIGYLLRADAWQFSKLVTGGMPVALGIAFMTLGTLSTPQRLWPIWLTLILSLGLVTANLAAVYLAGAMRLSVFPLLLALCTAGTDWIALDMLRRTAPRAVA